MVNSNVLEKYLKNNRREIFHYLSDKLGIIEKWKKKLKIKDPQKNFSREKSNYPYFQKSFLESLLGYEYSVDWVYEDSIYTSEGVVEFIVRDNNDQAILLIEIKDQNKILDKPQSSYGNKTPVQQAHNYALSNDNVVWYVVFNYNELRIYNKFEGYINEKYISFKLSEISDDEVFYLILLLSKTFFKEQRLLDEIKKETIIVEQEITDKIYMLYHETRLILIRQIQQFNHLDIRQCIKYAQLILNRIIFICFAEDRGLLPTQILEFAINHPIENRMLKKNRCSIWKSINYLFEDISKENKARHVAGYNGVLFIDNLCFLKIPDVFDQDNFFKDLDQEHNIMDENINRIIKFYQNSADGYLNPIYHNFLLLASFDFNTEIDVNIMGHIFEQSLTDLEELQEGLDLEAKAEKNRSLRKKEGIFYTPEYITEYICRNTIVTYLSRANANTVENLVDEYENELEVLEEKLNNIRILDFACGSGAFLNKAMQILVEIHKLIFLKKEVGSEDLNEIEFRKGIVQFSKENSFKAIELDVRRKIALDNIFGVDKNPESVGISKLSLFLQTVKRNKKLLTLKDNIKHGNSIIDNKDGQISEEFALELSVFNWEENFNEILQVGFDIVIGNPPYIRREKILDEAKPILEKKYSTYVGNADLYCYFYEKAMELLRPEGFLGFITSNKWMKTQYGAKLRGFLNNYHINEIIDFFELRVFEDASTEPAIIILNKKHCKNSEVKVTLMSTLDFENFNQYVKNNNFLFNQNNVEDSAVDTGQSQNNVWNFTGGLSKQIIDKMNEDSINLSEYLGEASIKMGIKPERVSVFRINKEKYEELISEDINSKDIIKPMIVGTSIHQYVYEFNEVYLILTKQGINIDNYPSIKKYLEEYKASLKERSSVKDGDSKWFELRPCDYYEEFEKEKIVYIHTAKKHKFALDIKKNYLINNCYIINSSDRYLLAYLNSELFEFYKKNTFVAFGDPRASGRCKLDHNKMERVPLKYINDEKREQITKHVNDIIKLHEEFFEKNNLYLKFILNSYRIINPSKKLTNFWSLHPTQFIEEIKKKKDLTLDQMQELHANFSNQLNNEIIPLIQSIQLKQNALDNFIYDIFNIDSDERIFVKQFLT